MYSMKIYLKPLSFLL